jgi:hypothetical protein
VALSRCIETRLMEAVLREVKACFAQADLGLSDEYGDRIYARPWMESDPLVAYTIYINPMPVTWEQGVGGVGESVYNVEVTFIFPWKAATFASGENSFLDHIEELRAYLFSGGTWPNNNNAIEDPDADNTSLAWIRSFGWAAPEPAPNNAGMAVPVLLGYLTRENESGVRA